MGLIAGGLNSQVSCNSIVPFAWVRISRKSFELPLVLVWGLGPFKSRGTDCWGLRFRLRGWDL